MRYFRLLLCSFLLLISQARAQGDQSSNLKKLAFIIGNKDYKYATALKNTVNDAEDMASALKAVGFETMLYTNLDYAGFIKAINSFSEKAPSYDVLLFYFSGHGMMYTGENYLVPVDASLTNNEKQIEVECVNIKRVTANFNTGEGKANIAIIDACRNKPFNRSWANSSRDLGITNQLLVKGVSGSIVAQSADEGETSSDNPQGRNGLYTSCLMKYIQQPGLTINEVFQLTRREVKERSKNKQNPIEFNQLIGNFYFIPSATASNSSTKPQTVSNPVETKQKKQQPTGNLPVSSPTVSEPIKNSSSQKTVKLMEGTTIRLALREELSSKTAAVGDIVELEVLDDVMAEDQVVIRANTALKGEVTVSAKAKMLGQQGKIDFTVNYVSSVDKQNIRLRSTQKFEGKNQTTGMAVAALFALPAVFIKGKEAVIPRGTRFNAYIDKDYVIRLAAE
jgi:hypothetical protein